MSWSSEDSPGTLPATVLAVGIVMAVAVGGCGHAPTTRGDDAFARELVLSYDDNRPSGQLAFPNLTYESLLRFELPPGKHRALRLRALLSGAGTLEIALYANSPLESPGDLLRRFTWTVAAADVSSGKDGHWLVSDLRDLSALEGVIWIGFRKTGGEPTMWTSSANSGQTFLRDRRPNDTMGILPVKRTPMLRLELLF
jgi:hypothetical protein